MIIDRLLQITGRIKTVKELYRLVNKGINTIIEGAKTVGKTFVLERVFKAFCNSERVNRKLLYVRAHGTRRDYEQIMFVMSEKYGDIHDEDCKEQTFNEFRKGNQQQIERRIITGIKNSDLPYVIFIEEMKKLPDSMRIFIKELLKTGKVSIVAEPKDMSDSKTRQFYQGFDRFEVRPMNDEKMGILFDDLVKSHSVRIKPEDYEEIKSKLLIETAGNPGRMKAIIERCTKEKEVNKEDILEKYASSHRREYPIGMSIMLCVVFFMAYRYFMRGLGTVTDMVCGGIIFALGILLYRISNKFK